MRSEWPGNIEDIARIIPIKAPGRGTRCSLFDFYFELIPRHFFPVVSEMKVVELNMLNIQYGCYLLCQCGLGCEDREIPRYIGRTFPEPDMPTMRMRIGAFASAIYIVCTLWC